MMWWRHHDSGVSGAMIGLWVLIVVLVVALVAVLVVLLRNADRQPRPGGTAPPLANARRLLAERFARGEIDADEYERRRSLLRDESDDGGDGRP